MSNKMDFPGMARVFSFTKVVVAAEQFASRAPYFCAILEREDGVRFPAFLVCVKNERTLLPGVSVTFEGCDENGKPQYALKN